MKDYNTTPAMEHRLELVGRETNISQYVLLETLSFMVSRKLNAGEKF